MKTISPQVLLEIMKVFHQIDEDDSGSIVYQDLVVALRTLTLPTTIRNIILVSMTDMDQDGDGHISFGEFQKAVRSGAANWSKKVEALIAKQKKDIIALEQERDALKEEYERVKRENKGMKDTLDLDPSKQQVSAKLSTDIDDILAKLRYVNEMRRIFQQIPKVPAIIPQ